MFHRTAMRRSMLGLIAGPLLGACSPHYVYQEDADTLYAEIRALAADRSAANEGECGLVTLKACLGVEITLVYSRASVDEDVLLEKVREYNHLIELIKAHRTDFACNAAPAPEIVNLATENGVCVARTSAPSDAP